MSNKECQKPTKMRTETTKYYEWKDQNDKLKRVNWWTKYDQNGRA